MKEKGSEERQYLFPLCLVIGSFFHISVFVISYGILFINILMFSWLLAQCAHTHLGIRQKYMQYAEYNACKCFTHIVINTVRLIVSSKYIKGAPPLNVHFLSLCDCCLRPAEVVHFTDT